MKSTSRLIFPALLAGLLAACGGGSGGTTLGTAALRGTVTAIDGDTGDRAGVPVTVVDTGETVETARDGSFRFDSIPTGTIRLAFGDRAPTLAQVIDDNEDDDGNRIIRDITEGDDVEIEVEIEDGEIRQFLRKDSGRSQASAHVGDDDDGIEAEVEIEEDDDGDEFEAEIEGLVPGTIVEFLVDDPNDELEPELVGTATADSEGEAELELETENGDDLPLDKLAVEDLAGLIVIFRDQEGGEELARVTIPDLGDFSREDDDEDDEDGDDDDEGDENEGEAELVALEAGLEGDVGIRSEGAEQRFEMEAENLSVGRVVRFEIEDIDTPGTFVSLGTRAADAEGEAEINTQDGLPMPFGVADVTDLVGLDVRVLDDDTDAVLLTGTVPPLGTED